MNDDKEKETGEEIRSLHDEVVKNFFVEKETAKSFFQEYLPPEITRNLDFGSLQASKDTFVDKNLSTYFSDLLYHISLNNMDAFIYLLIEHKSWEEFFTGFQLLKYMVRIWELYLKQNKKAKTLPVIIPIVIYHGYKKWQIDTHFISLFNVPEYVKDYIPDFNYNLHDISHYHDEEIKGVVLLRILFKTLKYIFTPELKSKLLEILQLFQELENKRKGTEYLEVLLRYIASSARSLTEEELKESVIQVFEEGGDFMATIAEKWTKEVKWDVVKNSLKEGLPINTIVRITGLSAEEINRMKEEMVKGKSSEASQAQL